MRITLDLSDDAYRIARTVAHEQNRSMGSVVSDFILGKLGRHIGPPEEDDAFPTFRCVRPVTSQDVRAISDGE